MFTLNNLTRIKNHHMLQKRNKTKYNIKKDECFQCLSMGFFFKFIHDKCQFSFNS